MIYSDIGQMVSHCISGDDNDDDDDDDDDDDISLVKLDYHIYIWRT